MKILPVLFVFLSATFVSAQETYPTRPGERDFIADEAGLIDEADQDRIREICDKLLTDKAVPIIVVTIDSLASYGARGGIERYAMNLFAEWGIGYKKWNHGILLLVSVADRKARIELGADWGHEKDALCQKIMDDWIIAKFKAGDFSGGIVAGVEKLDLMGRDLEIPSPPTPIWVYLAWIGFFGLAIFTVVSLIRRGASGWAWIFWAGVFVVVGYILHSMLTNRGGSSGGFGGGSFGGGFSGGGGATGSW